MLLSLKTIFLWEIKVPRSTDEVSSYNSILETQEWREPRRCEGEIIQTFQYLTYIGVMTSLGYLSGMRQ